MPEDVKTRKSKHEDLNLSRNEGSRNNENTSFQSDHSNQSNTDEHSDSEEKSDDERSVSEEGEVSDADESTASESEISDLSQSPPRKKYRDREDSHDSRRKRSPSDDKVRNYDKERNRAREKREDKRQRSRSHSRSRSHRRRSRSYSENDRKRKRRSESPRRSKKGRRKGSSKDSIKKDSAENGNSVKESVVEEKREPTARDLELQRLIKEEKEGHGLNEFDDEPVWSLKKAQIEKPSRQCPYLDTINRGVLDFDFEKLCSVSLSHLNVYACMVCGKYFQGRGTNTHAYTHSLDTDHRVYLNLQTLKFYCLPDNYEIIDPSLEDIKYVLRPTYTKKYIRGIDSNAKLSRAYDDTTYHPGVVGLNNIKANDYENVVLHVSPFRTLVQD
ncbi:hypothetical protein AB6A40_005383, partial [Gnathostoma spinigerum]